MSDFIENPLEDCSNNEDSSSENIPLNLSSPGSSNKSTSPFHNENMAANLLIANMTSLLTSLNNNKSEIANTDSSPLMPSIPTIMVNPSGIKQEPSYEFEPDDQDEEPADSTPKIEFDPIETPEQTIETDDEKPMETIEGSEKPSILCGTCNKALLDIPSFLEHCQEHKDENTPLKCAICGPNSKLLKTPYTLKKHQRFLHDMSKLKCPHCSKVFCPNYYKRHIKTAHTGAVKYDCTVCSKILYTRKGYTAHMEKHFPEKANHYTCPVCDKSIRESYLAKHIRYHQLAESFMCEICGIVMHNRGNFVYHQETHKTGKNRHLCEICGKSYKTNRVLKKHYTIHTGANKVSCTVCDAVLSNLHSLRTHMKTHQEERPFKCKFCGKGFKHPGHKIAHERIHTGERPYQCKICPSAFYEAGNLTKHMKKVHSNGKTSNKKFKFDCANDREPVYYPPEALSVSLDTTDAPNESEIAGS